MSDLGHLPIELVHDPAAVENRLTEPVAQSGERLGGRGQRLVQLDGIDLLGDRGDRFEQGLNSVVTADTSITSSAEMRCRDGVSGEMKDMYLLPNTVVARISAAT